MELQCAANNGYTFVIEASNDEDEMRQQIMQELPPDANDYTIVNSKGFISFDPTGMTLDEIALYVEFADEALNYDLFRVCVTNTDSIHEAWSLHRNFIGTWESKEAWAESLLGQVAIETRAGKSYLYFDYEKIANEQIANGIVEIFEFEGNSYVFACEL